MPKKQYYRIAKDRHEPGHVFTGSGERPLQGRFPDVEEIFKRCQPEGKDDRGDSVYLREDKDFSKVGVTYRKGYIHTVYPVGNATTQSQR